MAAVDKAGVAEPDSEALDRAAELASGFEENSQIQDWREKIQIYKDEKARAVKLKVEEQMTQLESLYAAVTGADASDLVDLTTKADTCLDAVVRDWHENVAEDMSEAWATIEQADWVSRGRQNRPVMGR